MKSLIYSLVMFGFSLGCIVNHGQHQGQDTAQQHKNNESAPSSSHVEKRMASLLGKFENEKKALKNQCSPKGAKTDMETLLKNYKTKASRLFYKKEEIEKAHNILKNRLAAPSRKTAKTWENKQRSPEPLETKEDSANSSTATKEDDYAIISEASKTASEHNSDMQEAFLQGAMKTIQAIEGTEASILDIHYMYRTWLKKLKDNLYDKFTAKQAEQIYKTIKERIPEKHKMSPRANALRSQWAKDLYVLRKKYLYDTVCQEEQNDEANKLYTKYKHKIGIIFQNDQTDDNKKNAIAHLWHDIRDFLPNWNHLTARQKNEAEYFSDDEPEESCVAWVTKEAAQKMEIAVILEEEEEDEVSPQENAQEKDEVSSQENAQEKDEVSPQDNLADSGNPPQDSRTILNRLHILFPPQ